MVATGKTVNALCAAYLENPEEYLESLLAAVHRLAKKTFHDDDRAQEFAIMTWQYLPKSTHLPCTLGGWVWRQLQWRRIDHFRARCSRLRHEMQVPESMEEGDDLTCPRKTQPLKTGVLS